MTKRKMRFAWVLSACLLCVAAQETDFGRFLKFEPLTLCPYDRKLVAVEMLTCDERRWLNNYHERVKEVLMPLLASEQEKAWLENATLAI